ncbi:hypothetical protein ACHAWF_014330 [Thalassiosira exigua]
MRLRGYKRPRATQSPARTHCCVPTVRSQRHFSAASAYRSYSTLQNDGNGDSVAGSESPSQSTSEEVGELSFQRIASENSRKDRKRAVEVLSKRIPWYLSDLNLRHNNWLRFILQQNDNQFLPLNSTKPLQRLIRDPSIVREAIQTMRDRIPPGHKYPVELDFEERNGGEVMLKRTPPFNYSESLRSSRSKMMVVEGWPKGRKHHWAESLVRSLLCADTGSTAHGDEPEHIDVAYWNIGRSNGVLDVEFKSEDGAAIAWDNLERAVSHQVDLADASPAHDSTISVQPLNCDEENKSYQILIGGELSLVARRIDAPATVAEKTGPNRAPDKTAKSEKKVASSLATEHQTKTEVQCERTTAVEGLSQRLSFFFSDIHLRHNEYVRTILEERHCLPLNSIGSFQKFISDPAVVLDAVNHANSSAPVPGKSTIKLNLEEADGGEILVSRSPPFQYKDSLRNSHHKMMVVEGWPRGPKPRWAKALVHSMLCTDMTSNESSPTPVAYWRFDNSKGVLKVEFESEEGAMGAWNNLELAMSRDDLGTSLSGYKVSVQPMQSDQYGRSYRLQIDGEFALVVRSIEDESLSVSDSTISHDISPGETDAAPISPQKPRSAETDIALRESDAALTSPQKPRSAETSPDTKPLTPSPSSDQLSYDRRYAKLEANGTLSLNQFSRAMDQLYEAHKTLPPPSREWLHENVRGTNKQRHRNRTKTDSELQQQLLERRHEICHDAANVLSCVKASIGRGKIRALGSKDSYLLSDSLGRAMLIFSETPSEHGGSGMSDATNIPSELAVSPYEACLDALGILRRLNLDIHPSHFSYVIRAACHESRWEEAAKIFLRQIDGDDAANMATGGFVPIDLTLGWDRPLEVGLYAVARNCKENIAPARVEHSIEASPSKRVFDTAMKMCMISPSGQESYILAAGSALGRAGLGKDCLDFARDSTSISTYGPSIAAAVMLACIESSRYADAINAYDFFVGGDQSAASEWQWAGGNFTAMKPLCRDLALHALGNVKKARLSHNAMIMFREIIDEDSPISVNALAGLAQSLENDRDLQTCIKLLDSFLESVYHQGNPKWRIRSNALELNNSISNETPLTLEDKNNLLATILASVMRVCNGKRHHGLGLTICSTVNTAHVHQQKKTNHDSLKCTGNAALDSILSHQLVTENQPILSAYVSSLHALGCEHIANELMDAAHNGSSDSASTVPTVLRSGLPYAESLAHALIAMDRVLKAADSIRSDGYFPPESRVIFERGLARAIDHFIDCSQPEAALHLFGHAINQVSKRDASKRDATWADQLKSFFASDTPAGGEIFQRDDEVDIKDLHLSDPLLSSLMNTYTKMGQPDKALSTFDDGTSHLEDSSIMTQSTNSYMEALLDIDIALCKTAVEEVGEKSVNPSIFLAIAKQYARNQMWPQIGELYNKAREAGCVSEDLALLTMQAVCESELLEGKILVLRSILGDVSSLVGMKRSDWIESKYWGIKRYVGYHYARLLMRWNDPATSQKEELLFAINEMRTCAREGIAAKNAPLECIARIAQVYGTEGRVESVLTRSQRRSAVNLILEACVEANKSGLMKKYMFTAEVARNLRALGANKECIQVVHSIISPGKKCKHKVAMEEAMYAALEERDNDSLQVITEVYELSGYDSKRLSI